MGKYYSAWDTVAKTCFGYIFKFADGKKTNRKFYGPDHLVGLFYENLDSFFVSDEEKEWLHDPDNKDLLLAWANEQAEKKPMLFNQNSPLEDRIMFGYGDDRYDIDFGLNRAHDDRKVLGKVSDEEYSALLGSHLPWSNLHVARQIKQNYGELLTLKKILKKVSTSHLEKKLADFWLKNFYGKKRPNNPALIPEICGAGSKKFWVGKKGNGWYKLKKPNWGESTALVRFDFAIINYNKQKKLIIELDGYHYHKSKKQQNNDTVKRNLIEKLGWEFRSYTTIQIETQFDSVIDQLEPFFRPD